MSIDTSAPRLNFDLQTSQKTPVGILLAQAEEFKKEGDKQALQLQSFSDSVLFQRETQRLYKTITDTIHLLSTQGIPYAEIQKRVSTALNLYRGQLANSLNQFKEKEAHFNAASASFNPASARAARTASSGNDFTPPQVALSDRIKNRKNAMAKCLLTSMDPESIKGAMPCLQKHSEGLSEGEKKELSAAVPSLVAGKALTELAVVPAVVAEAANTLVKVAVKGLVLGSVMEGLVESKGCQVPATVVGGNPQPEARNQHEFLQDTRQAFNEKNPQFNKVMREIVPEPVKSGAKATAAVIQKGVDYAAEVDRYTQERFNTLPGVVQAGMVGTVEIGIQIGTAAAAGPIIRGSASLIRAAGRSVQAAAEVVATTSRSVVQGLESSDIVLGTARFMQAVTNTPTPAFALVPARQHVIAFARCETGSVKLPTFLSELAKRIKENMKSVELPLSQVELDRLIRNGGFREVPGGKGGHKKYLKETPERDVIIRPSGEVSIGVQHQILKKIARSKALESLESSPETTIINPKVNTGYHNRPLPHRLDYSNDYFQAGIEFINVKEFNGIFSRDLLAVQYHSSAPLGELRTYKWFMPACQGNKLCTIESVMDTVSKLTQYGEITHVSVAKIPAGEPVRMLHGRAVSKFDADAQIIRPGGGVQYRFFDFDPNWILVTKKLP